jgi:ABC-type multidrug transport system ATPase subunit
MEEADVLGDRVCVMAKGRLRAIDNSIALKNKFGAGYRVSVVTTTQNASKVKDMVKSIIPEAVLEDDSAGALIYQFPHTAIKSVPTLVELLEENKDGLINSWGISQSTLEDVFLKLIREANSKFTE